MTDPTPDPDLFDHPERATGRDPAGAWQTYRPAGRHTRPPVRRRPLRPRGLTTYDLPGVRPAPTPWAALVLAGAVGAVVGGTATSVWWLW